MPSDFFLEIYLAFVLGWGCGSAGVRGDVVSAVLLGSGIIVNILR